MSVYLTGVHTIKTPKNKNKEKIEKDKELNKDKSDIIEEDVSSESDKKSGYENQRNNLKKSYELLKKSLTNNKDEKIINNWNINNNYISKDDQNKNIKNKNNFLTERDFSLIRHKALENKKNNEILANELKEDYLEYIMQKEPKYADFDQIFEDYRKKIYSSFQKYNNNLLVISRKKEEKIKITAEIEKSLVNNYYLKDSSMLPVYESLIQKLKMDILTKQQEHDGYKKIHEELYNKNYTLRRKVLDEIDIDRSNEYFYDQYKILKNHAVVQVSKKQDTLNQFEEYQQKMKEEHEKELKQKNKILKDLKLEIEVFKEDEKELLNKLKKLKVKKDLLNKSIREKEKRLKNNEINYIHAIKRYQRSYISMNKIFKSVNAKNLEDVLVDVNHIKSKFNNLKNSIIGLNKDISNLNGEYSQYKNELMSIEKQIALNKNKINIFNEEEQNKIIEIKNNLKKIKENNLRTKEIIQNNIGSYQNGITFIFQKIKLLVINIEILNDVISPKLSELINKYKNSPFSIDYNNIDNEFLKNFAYLFFQFSNIIFYLSLRSMTSGINVDYVSKKNFIIPIYNKLLLNKYAAGVRKSIKEFGRVSILKIEKIKELNEKIKKEKQIKKNIDNELLNMENKAITQNQMFNRFVEYLHNKDNNNNSNSNSNVYNDKNDFKNKTSFFFTGIDSAKATQSRNNETSSAMSSVNYDENVSKVNQNKINNDNCKGFGFTLQQKEDFLQKNKNKVMNIFSKYQNTLVKENDKNLYYQKKYMKKMPRASSQERINKKPKIIKQNPIIENKRKIMQEESNDKKKSMPLLDENYEYDEDDEKEEKKNKESILLKQNKTYSKFSFFKLNKDRANIYKKLNDLRKLQMAYFGGRFLNTKISNGMNDTYGVNTFDDFVNNIYRTQNEYSRIFRFIKNKSSYGNSLSNGLRSNKKLTNMTMSVGRSDKFNEIGKNKMLRNKSDVMKTSFSMYNGKTTIASTKNNKSNNQYKKIDNNELQSQSTQNYRTISVKKNQPRKYTNRYYNKKF